MRARCLNRKCLMGFRVGGPNGYMKPEWLRCSECNLRFWTASTYSKTSNSAIVGVLPGDMTDNLVTEDVA